MMSHGIGTVFSPVYQEAAVLYEQDGRRVLRQGAASTSLTVGADLMTQKLCTAKASSVRRAR